MSEFRIKLLDLAIKAGATIESATKVASDWEHWATKDDPLRFGAPSPKWQHESEISESDYQGIRAGLHGVDWSRPQLVVDVDDSDFVVRTTGKHVMGTFSGYGPEDGDVPDEYKKKRFVYHGEIPEENKEIDWSRPQLVREVDGPRIGITNGKHHKDWFEAEMSYPGIGFNKVLQFSSYPKREFVYHGEIPQEQKTEGLNFLEAIHACKSGKNVARNSWGDVHPVFMYHSNMNLYRQDGEEAELDMECYLATDWQIVK